MAAATAKRISTWQDLRAWERHSAQLDDLKARAMREARFENMARRRRLRRLPLDHLDLLRAPPRGALALVELLAMAVVHWKTDGKATSGLWVRAATLARHCGCSRSQIAHVVAWLDARGLVQQIRLWEPLRPGRGGGVKHAEVSSLYVPGDVLDDLLAERGRQAQRSIVASEVPAVAVPGSQNLRSDSSVALSKAQSRSQARGAARDRQAAVDRLLGRDRVARAAESNERVRRRTRQNDCPVADAAADVEAIATPAPSPVRAGEGVGSRSTREHSADAPQLSPEARSDASPSADTPEKIAAPATGEKRTQYALSDIGVAPSPEKIARFCLDTLLTVAGRNSARGAQQLLQTVELLDRITPEPPAPSTSAPASVSRAPASSRQADKPRVSPDRRRSSAGDTRPRRIDSGTYAGCASDRDERERERRLRHSRRDDHPSRPTPLGVVVDAVKPSRDDEGSS